MLEKIKKFTGRASVLVSLAWLVTGCFGGGGSDTPATLTYSGNTDSAVITLQNATTLVANVLYGGESGTNIPVAVSVSENSVRSAGVLTQVETFQAIAKIIEDKIGSNDVSLARILTGIDIDEPLECESGTGFLSGELDDVTATGTLIFTYDNCLVEGTTYNGTGSFIVDYFDFGYLLPTDVRVVFSLMTVSSAEFSGSISGTIRLQTMIEMNAETITLNYVAKDNLTGKMYKYDNFDVATVYDNFYTPTSKTQGYIGTPARVYDSTYGYVDVKTLTSLAFSSVSLTYPDLDGVMVFTGAAGSSIRVTVLSGEQLQLELDIDGLPGYEESRILFWNDLAVNADTDLTGIEQVQVLRVPLSGSTLSGLDSNSYIGQTFKMQQAVSAEKLTVYIANATTGIDLQLLLVEVDTTSGTPRPTNVLFESEKISVASTYGTVPVTVDFKSISLNAEQTYAWLLDGYVYGSADTLQSANIAVGWPDPYADGSIIFSGSFVSHTTTREENFADFWYESSQSDMSFILEYKVIDNSGT